MATAILLCVNTMHIPASVKNLRAVSEIVAFPILFSSIDERQKVFCISRTEYLHTCLESIPPEWRIVILVQPTR